MNNDRYRQKALRPSPIIILRVIKNYYSAKSNTYVVNRSAVMFRFVDEKSILKASCQATRMSMLPYQIKAISSAERLIANIEYFPHELMFKDFHREGLCVDRLCAFDLHFLWELRRIGFVWKGQILFSFEFLNLDCETKFICFSRRIWFHFAIRLHDLHKYRHSIGIIASFNKSFNV